jgi:hypothetical protein
LTHLPFDGIVVGEGVGIHVDLPAHTTGMAAVRRGTKKRLIIVGYNNRFHTDILSKETKPPYTSEALSKTAHSDTGMLFDSEQIELAV